MFDELGMNLRNRGAHGLLRDEECNQFTTDILMLAIVALLRVAGADAVDGAEPSGVSDEAMPAGEG